MAKGWVYLAGPIGGKSYEGAVDWREDMKKKLEDLGMVCFSPMRAKEFLRGVESIDEQEYEHPMATPDGITCRDRFDVKRSDIVLMNLLDAEENISIGTCIEIGWADMMSKPVVLICKRDGVYHKHPMVKRMCPFIVHDKETAIETISMILLP